MTLKCAIIDDEPLAAGLLESYARKTPFIEVTGVYNSAVEAMAGLRQSPADIVFLDIQMPELSGMELAKLLPRQTKVIFTTAFSQYAIEGYKVEALDYLLKPISYEEFLRAANKALSLFETSNATEAKAEGRFLFVKSEYKLMRIDFDDILFIEGLKDYVKIYMDNGERPVMSIMNMKDLESFLPKNEFIRTHRSYIVHATKIKVIDRSRVVFGDNYIPISDSYKDTVQKYVDGHMA